MNGHEHRTEVRPGECGVKGPYQYVCTDQSGHSYTHYDSRQDSSWPDNWWTHWNVPLRHHPDDCRCGADHNPAQALAAAPEATDTG